MQNFRLFSKLVSIRTCPITSLCDSQANSSLWSTILDGYFTASPVLRCPELRPLPHSLMTLLSISMRKQKQTEDNFQKLPPGDLFNCLYPHLRTLPSLLSYVNNSMTEWSPYSVQQILFISSHLFKDDDRVICSPILNYYFFPASVDCTYALFLPP